MNRLRQPGAVLPTTLRPNRGTGGTTRPVAYQQGFASALLAATAQPTLLPQRTGWPAILSGLKSVLETGKPLLIEMQPPNEMLAALQRLKGK
jgi:hypothetical protein